MELDHRGAYKGCRESRSSSGCLRGAVCSEVICRILSRTSHSGAQLVPGALERQRGGLALVPVRAQDGEKHYQGHRWYGVRARSM